MWTKRVFAISVVLLSMGHDAVAGLVGYWAFEEGAGTVAKDTSGKGRDGQLVAGPQWVTGKTGGALRFDGVQDKANDVGAAATLTWMPGAVAVKHHVYFGDDLDAVTQGAADVDKGTLTETTLAPGTLESLKIYYWRVDETVAGGTVKAGPVWSFTTYLPVDDFESYTDEEGKRIYETWIDGWTNNTGSTVGYAQAPFAEQMIVHAGKQSMPLDYNNVRSPFYSEAQREFEPVQDWTVSGADMLVLSIRGRAANTPAQLYVAIEDASKHVGVVAYPDAAVTGTSKWTEWKIPLSSFTGVNPAKVKKLYIGVGDRESPAAGGSGRIYIDDIRVTKP